MNLALFNVEVYTFENLLAFDCSVKVFDFELAQGSCFLPIFFLSYLVERERYDIRHIKSFVPRHQRIIATYVIQEMAPFGDGRVTKADQPAVAAYIRRLA